MAEKQAERKLLLGNEALARGAYEAGVKVASAYPGTPSTEVSESLVQYKDELYCEWAPNEKVALEVAIGASFTGARAMATMKHVGLNVAADPLYTAAYTGVNAGLVLVVADDPGLYSSQNEQDTRMVGRAANVPVLEPSDSQEAKDFMIEAFRLSETFDTPVIVRSTTRLSHSQGMVELLPREEHEKDYAKNPQKFVMVPAHAKLRHPDVVARQKALAEAASDMPQLNRTELRDRKIGFITSGIAYQYVREAMPEASVLKLGLVNPLPRKQIEAFAREVDELYIFEELEPVIEEQVKSWGIACKGKEIFPEVGEYSATILKKVFLKSEPAAAAFAEEVPGRPPILCPGCPHRAVFSVMNKLKLHAAGDIGCYTLGAGAPLNVIETCVCMGASIGTLHGMEKAHGRDYIKNWVAVIGDSTFLHTGVNSLMNMVYNGSTATVVILDNSITAMTGHQHNPATGKTLMGTPAPAVSLKGLCESLGVKHVTEIYSFDLKGLEKLLKEETARDELSVIITQSPCVLLKENPPIRHQYKVDADECRACGMCLKPGCPALTRDENGKALINDTMCNGCGLCYRLCPFDAIKMTDSVIDKI